MNDHAIDRSLDDDFRTAESVLSRPHRVGIERFEVSVVLSLRMRRRKEDGEVDQLLPPCESFLGSARNLRQIWCNQQREVRSRG